VHELSIVYSIITSATEAAEREKATLVKVVTLRLGALAGVVEDSLQFCFEAATKDTMLEGSTLVVHRLPVIIHCATCKKDHEIQGIQSYRCPVCDAPSFDLRQGRELEIESLEIEVGDDNPDR